MPSLRPQDDLRPATSRPQDDLRPATSTGAAGYLIKLAQYPHREPDTWPARALRRLGRAMRRLGAALTGSAA